MSIYETFYMLFKVDTSDLEKGNEKAKKSTKKVTEELTEMGKATKRIGEGFQSWATSLVSAAAAFASIHSLVNGLKGAVDYDIALGNASRALGVNVSELDAWDNAVQKTGGTAEGFQGSLKALADHFHTTAKVAMQALPQLADVFSHISRYSAFTYGKALGLDEPTILLLQQGRREVESVLKKQRELGVVTKEQTEIALQYRNSLVDLKTSFRSLFNSIAIDALPYIEKFFSLIEKGINYLLQHKDFVKGVFIGVGIAAASAVVALSLVNLAISGWILLLVIAVGLFALLWDDISVFSKGGKSVFGELSPSALKFITILGTGLKGALLVLNPLIKGFQLLLSILKEIKEIDSADQSGSTFTFGQKYLQNASNTPLNSMNSNTVLNSSAFSKNLSINTGDTIIHTQATDAVGISKEIGLRFEDHYGLATNFFATNSHA